MKKKKIMTGVAVGAALAGVVLGGCARVQNLYGPPPDTEDALESETPYEGELSQEETLYGPPGETDSVPEAEIPSDAELSTAAPLYGPPPDVEA